MILVRRLGAAAFWIAAVAVSFGGLHAQSTLVEARRKFQTKPAGSQGETEPLAEPVAPFRKIEYPTSLGRMSAWIGTPDSVPKSGKPAGMIWVTGGFPPGGIDAAAWVPLSHEQDPSAKQYRLAGMVMMYPTFRGANGNPGRQESFLGEVDDLLAARDYLAKSGLVDPARIYLGGHSTGGTLVLLAAASTDAFRAVISFGPVEDPVAYGGSQLAFDVTDEAESRLRAPIHWLDQIKTPTFVIEGDQGNLTNLEALRDASKNPRLQFVTIEGANHMNLLQPLQRVIARTLAAADAGSAPALTAEDLQRAFDAQQRASFEGSVLQDVAHARGEGAELDEECDYLFYLRCDESSSLDAAVEAAQGAGFQFFDRTELEDRRGRSQHQARLRRRMALTPFDGLFNRVDGLRKVAVEHEVEYLGFRVLR
ncbi:MAG: prolyl oligopeptidase family serine peptidase [Planctomycetota bacterium]